MIVGVDHIALSCADLDTAVNRLSTWGFNARFAAHGIRNDPSKRPFLQQYDRTHDIAYCCAPQGVSIELTQHAAELRPEVSRYQVLFSEMPPDVVDFQESLPVEWADAMRGEGSLSPVPGFSEALCAQLWYQQQPTSRGVHVRGVVLPVTDLDLAERFWVQGLGAMRAEQSSGSPQTWRKVRFARPVPAWSLDLLLVAAPGYHYTSGFLDVAGFPCLALLTNRLDEDLERACDSGGHSPSEAFAIEVDGNLLKVVLLRGSSDELVELIEVHR